MPNSIREYLEKGRAGKIFDVNRNLWIDPVSGKAFIPTFTNIQGGEDMNVRPYRGGQFPSGRPTQDLSGGPVTQEVAEYAGGDPNVPIEQRPAHLVGREEGVTMGPGGMPQKAMKTPEAPDPDDPLQMSHHVVSQMIKKGEFNKILGIKPGQKVDPKSELGKARTKLISNTFKQMGDHYALKDRAKKSYRQDVMKKSKMDVDKIYRHVNELMNPPVDPVTNRPKTQPMSEEEALNHVFGVMGKINKFIGTQKGGTAATTQRPTGPTMKTGRELYQNPQAQKQQGRVVGRLRDKKSGQTVDVYEDGTAIINGQKRRVPEHILKKHGIQIKRPAPAPATGGVSPIPSSKIPGKSGSELDAMLETGQPQIGFNYQVPGAYKDMYSQYLKQ